MPGPWVPLLLFLRVLQALHDLRPASLRNVHRAQLHCWLAVSCVLASGMLLPTAQASVGRRCMLLHLRFLQALHTLRPASLSKVQWAQHHGWLGEWCIDVDQQFCKILFEKGCFGKWARRCGGCVCPLPGDMTPCTYAPPVYVRPLLTPERGPNFNPSRVTPR